MQRTIIKFCNICRKDTKFKMRIWYINNVKYYKCTCTNNCGWEELNNPETIIKQIERVKAIPKGEYCYDKNGKCPHWHLKKDLPEQSNGYCSYLYMNDINIRNKGLGIGLLWDAIKECGINE